MQNANIIIPGNTYQNPIENVSKTLRELFSS